MNDTEKEFINQWLVKANEDARAANELFENENPLCGVICFHCQQAIEKILKAYLLYQGNELTKTHNIDFLLGEAKKYDDAFLGIDLLDLNQYAVKVRYPDDFNIPSVSETKVFISITQAVKELTEAKIILK